jgi:hypothetical protein
MKNKLFEMALQKFLKNPEKDTEGFLLHSLFLKTAIYGKLDPEKHGGDDAALALADAFEGISVPDEKLKELCWLSEAMIGLCTDKRLTSNEHQEAAELSKFLGILVSCINDKFDTRNEKNVPLLSRKQENIIQTPFVKLLQEKKILIQKKTLLILEEGPKLRVDSSFKLEASPTLESKLDELNKHAWKLLLKKMHSTQENELTQKTDTLLEHTKFDDILKPKNNPSFNK